MAADARDREALDLLASRTFADAALVSFALDLQTRRLTLCCYGALGRGNVSTVLATLIFFGTASLASGGEPTCPQSARLAALRVRYDAADDEGFARVEGRSGWTLQFRFAGFAFEEHPAILASLADD